MGPYLKSGDIRDVRQIQHIPRPASQFNHGALRSIAAAYPDQDLLGQAESYDPGDKRGVASAATNHMSGLQNHGFGVQSMSKEVDEGRVQRWYPKRQRTASGVPAWLDDGFQVWPFRDSPAGSTEKTDAEGNVKEDERRETIDYSWPPPSTELAKIVDSPNATIDLDLMPQFEWFRLRRIFEQIHYLKQFQVPLSFAKWDFASYYRCFRLIASAIPSHMRMWCDLDGEPHWVADFAQMFGDAAAANVASRMSGLVVWCLHLLTDRL